MKISTIIIGAGPAGLQLGFFLEKADIDYIILEKSTLSGSFFNRYPHSGKLISINKKYTGNTDPEYNMRHDWNSLLSDDDVRFTQYSDDYYPSNEDLVKYLNDYSKRHSLKIQYNTTVNRITKDDHEYTLETSAGIYTCTKLVVAIGLSKPIIPDIFKNEPTKILHYADYEKDYFKKKENLLLFQNKNVLIIGGGNSSYELGNLLTPHCSTVIISTRSVKKWALSSHYTGDLRAVYMSFVDTFLLKSLNVIAVDRFDKTSSPLRSYDIIIFCTGWMFDKSLFDFPLNLTQNEKFPLIKDNFESSGNKNLYFIGSLMHSLDFKRSSGGFIHGFRYLIKYFFQTNFTQKYDVYSYDFDEMIQHISYRINNAGALYQMYGEMCDLFYYDSDKFTYYDSVKPNTFPIETTYFTVSLEYGEEITEMSKISAKKRTQKGYEINSHLVHPVLKVYKNKQLFDEIHFEDDVLIDFKDPVKYTHKFIRSIRMFI